MDNIDIRIGTKLYRQIFGIKMGTNCAPLVHVADFVLFCYERDLMDKLSNDNQAKISEAFNSMSRYLDDLLNIGNPYFEGIVNKIYPPELQLNKLVLQIPRPPFWIRIISICISNGFHLQIIYDKREGFDFDIVNFPILDGEISRRPCYGVYISQLIRFSRVCIHDGDFNACNKC